MSAMISATIPLKRKRIPKQFFEAPVVAAASPAVTIAAAKKGCRTKMKAVGPRGAPPSKVKTKAVSRISLAPPPPSKATAPPPSVPSAATPVPLPPEGSKKAKERMKVEGEAASFKEKLDQLMKSKEVLTMKTLETKLLITKKKKEVKLAMVEARWEDAKVKAELESRMIALKEAKAMKEPLAEEREIMMMHTEDMDEDQLAWWKETKADIMARKMLTHQACAASAIGALTPRGESPVSGGGAGDGLIDG
jgi:hypothetical protein